MEKKVLVVTGASKGIGLQIVLAGLKAGYQVVGTSRNKERLTQEVQTQLPEFQSNLYAVNMPFDEEGIRQGITTSNQSCGRRSQSKCCFESKYGTRIKKARVKIRLGKCIIFSDNESFVLENSNQIKKP